MQTAFLNRVVSATPENDVHDAFVQFALNRLKNLPREQRLFRRLAEMGQIEHRYSIFEASKDPCGPSLDTSDFYLQEKFPSTGARMSLYESEAPKLAIKAVTRLDLGDQRTSITHLVITSCTGFSAPGVDLQLIELLDLPSTVERTVVGFMGCYAAINGLKLARHIVRSEPSSKVLLINLEICSLHLKESTNLEEILSFFLFADGCAASIISAEPQGISLDSFHSILAPATQPLITWNIGDAGFDMKLSGQVPNGIRATLCEQSETVLKGDSVQEITHWAVHPGGRTVLDAVQDGLDLSPESLWASREVLRDFGNMSSATVMFVLEKLMPTMKAGDLGSAMSFGPGLVAETMRFTAAA